MGMNREAAGADPGLLDVAWAVVVLQAGMTLLSALEGSLGGLLFGSVSAAAVVGILNLTGAVLAFAAARGIRKRRRWARRITIVAESLILMLGMLGALASSLIAAETLGLVSIVTTIIAPIVVIAILFNTRSLFSTKPSVMSQPERMEVMSP